MLCGELIALMATGIWLFFLYRPTQAQAWDDIATLHSDVTFGVVVREIHRVASFLALCTAAVVGVLVVVDGALRRRPARSVAIAGALVFVVAAASVSGYLLPWDQLALWAVTVGTNMNGYRPLFGDQVRFVLLGGQEIGTSTLLRWLVIHGALLGPTAVALAAVARGRKSSDATNDR